MRAETGLGMRRVAASIGVTLALFATPALAEMIDGYPDAIVCHVSDFRSIGYLHRVNDDGSAIYMTLGQELARVTADGVFHREGAKDCDGKTLKQLEADGQAFEFE
ncbi:MAG: hypothetical protein KDJ88_01955 [Bauldia sp.]|nr:hypothetical protein [Bauldia sp.]